VVPDRPPSYLREAQDKGRKQGRKFKSSPVIRRFAVRSRTDAGHFWRQCRGPNQNYGLHRCHWALAILKMRARAVPFRQGEDKK
jgi:hypothetical protein